MSKLAGQASGLASQPVSRLAELLFEHRSSLEARAARILKDPIEAADVVQEAFFKFMVAAPDLADEIQALAYLRTTVTNLSISVLRKKQVRPTLTAIDESNVDDEFQRAIAFDVDNDDALIRAEDAAIVRLALSKLSAGQRQALVMRDVTGLEIEEIAREFGVKPGNARVIVHRAREAFRRALETTIVDAERGLTAADMLSVSVQKAAKASKTIGKAALALLLVVSGIGFAMNRTDGSVKEIAGPVPVTSPSASPSASASAEPSARASVSVSASAAAVSTPDAVAIASSIPAPVVTDDFQSRLDSTIRMFGRVSDSLDQIRQDLGPVAWPGVDANGVPTGVTVSDGTSLGQALVLNQSSEIMLDGRIVKKSDVMTVSNGIDLMLSQSITRHLDGRIEYSMSPSVKINGVYRDLKVTSKSVSSRELGSSQILLEIWALIDTSALSATFTAPSLGGRELTSAPEAIGIRIHTTAIGQPIFAQSIYLVEVTK
jgi:RNA polymerase sigma factor (sigma-70 family)